MATDIYIALSSFAKESPHALRALEQSGFSFEINTSGKRLTANEIVHVVQQFRVVVAGLEPYDKHVLAQLPKLECISRCGVGIDNIDLAYAQQRGIKILNTPDVVVQPVAELTIAMILGLLRQVVRHAQLMQSHRWEKLTGYQLSGKTVGVIGLGRIGKRVAELLCMLGCRVVAYDIHIDHQWALAHDVKQVGIEELLSVSDIVTLHLGGGVDTKFVMDANVFRVMKQGAFLINTSRGIFINEQDLHQALVSGRLAGAGLDVYQQEPYQGPLCDLPNVILSPHVATLTVESRAQMELEAVCNATAYLRGRTKG